MDEWDDADVDDSDLLSLLSLPVFPTPANIKSNINDSNDATPAPSPFLRGCTSSQSRPSPSKSKPPPVSPPRVQVPEPETSGHLRSAAPPSRCRRIPGPAGEVQARMQRELAAAEWYEERRIRGEQATDRDDEGCFGDTAGGEEFETGPWISAMDFLGERGGACSNTCPISSIKAPADNTAYRVDQVVGIISSCKPNGLGGFYATLKDPTGSIGAFVHSKPVDDNCFRDITVGCVLVLRQVVVFPVRTAIYLNVTLNNVAKLISNESELSQKVLTQSSRVKRSHDAPGKWTNTAVDEPECRMKLGLDSAKHQRHNVTDKASPEAVDIMVASQGPLQNNTRNGKSRRIASNGCGQGSLWRQGTDKDKHGAALARTASCKEVEETVTVMAASIGASEIRNRGGFETISSVRDVNPSCESTASTVRSTSAIASGLLKSQPSTLGSNNTAAPSGNNTPDGKNGTAMNGIKSFSSAMQGVPAAYPPTMLNVAESSANHGATSSVNKLVMDTSAAQDPDWTDDQLAELFSDYPEADDISQFGFCVPTQNPKFG